MSIVGRIRSEAEAACERLGLPAEELQIIVAKTYGPRDLDEIVPPYITVVVFGAGKKPYTFSAESLDDAGGMAVRRLELVG